MTVETIYRYKCECCGKIWEGADKKSSKIVLQGETGEKIIGNIEHCLSYLVPQWGNLCASCTRILRDWLGR